MDKKFQDAKDKYVVAVLAYAKEENNVNYLYEDAEFEKPLDANKALDLFFKGVLMVITETNDIYRIVGLKDSEDKLVDCLGNKYSI